MNHPKTLQAHGLLVGLCVLLVAVNHIVATPAVVTQQVSNIDDFGAVVVAASSLVDNQMAVLKLLNKSSTICSLHERQLQEMLESGVDAERLRELQINEVDLEMIENVQPTPPDEAVLRDVTTQVTQSLSDFKRTVSEEIKMMKMEIIKELRHELGKGKSKTYEKFDAPVTQQEAIQACKDRGGRLALPTNSEEENLITRKIGFEWSGGYWDAVYWISGTDEQQERNWVDNITGEPLLYTNFKSGQPDNKNRAQHCLNKSPTYRGWDDRECDHVGVGYVCEFAT